MRLRVRRSGSPIRLPTEVRAPKVRRALQLLGEWETNWADAMLEPLERTRRSGCDWTWSRGFIETYRRSGSPDDFRAGEGAACDVAGEARDVIDDDGAPLRGGGAG